MTPIHVADPQTPGWIDDALAQALPVSMPGSSDDPLVRFDDLRRHVGLVLVDHVETRTTSDIAGVVEVLRAVERHAAAGHWVAVMLAYEAGAAFDPAFPRRPPPSGVPLAWIAAFRSCRRVEPVSPPDHAPATTDIRRRGGSDWFVQGVGRCRDLIERGSTYQVNLTDRFDATLAGDPFELYRSMATTQGGACNAYLDLGGLVVVSASPELFVRVERDHVVARPMKGTARRSSRPADDERTGEALVRSDKDRAENVMIVDLMRNDLGRLAPFGGVTVPALFDAERYGTVWQLTSTVRAAVAPQVTLTEVLGATFPCGSVTGAPKVAAMRAIDAIEPWPRGVYCGAIGLVTPQLFGVSGERPAATFSVAIRTAVIHRATGAVEFGTGAGITWSSDPVAEDTELEDKAAVLTDALPDFQLLETLRVDADHAVSLDDHLSRLELSARYFGFDCDLDAARRTCAATITARPFDGPRRMRIRLGRDGRWFVELHPLETASVAPVLLAVAPHAVRSDDVFCAHKTTHRTLYEQVAARHPGVDDVLLGNERGEITETCRANVLYRIGAAWFTPPLASGGLAGIGRRHLLDNGTVTERVLAFDELAEIDELAIVSSLRGRRRAVLAR